MKRKGCVQETCARRLGNSLDRERNSEVKAFKRIPKFIQRSVIIGENRYSGMI